MITKLKVFCLKNHQYYKAILELFHIDIINTDDRVYLDYTWVCLLVQNKLTYYRDNDR